MLRAKSSGKRISQLAQLFLNSLSAQNRSWRLFCSTFIIFIFFYLFSLAVADCHIIGKCNFCSGFWCYSFRFPAERLNWIKLRKYAACLTFRPPPYGSALKLAALEFLEFAVYIFFLNASTASDGTTKALQPGWVAIFGTYCCTFTSSPLISLNLLPFWREWCGGVSKASLISSVTTARHQCGVACGRIHFPCRSCDPILHRTVFHPVSIFTPDFPVFCSFRSVFSFLSF